MPNLEVISADRFIEFMAAHLTKSVCEVSMRELEVLNTQGI
jgi:hypothetical protein